jgi:hypothetical protein
MTIGFGVLFAANDFLALSLNAYVRDTWPE